MRFFRPGGNVSLFGTKAPIGRLHDEGEDDVQIATTKTPPISKFGFAVPSADTVPSLETGQCSEQVHEVTPAATASATKPSQGREK